MELVQAIENRVSIRNFSAEAVSKKDLEELVRRAALAPSINNAQPWKFLVITRCSLLKEMGEAVSKAVGEIPVAEREGPGKAFLSRIEWFSTFFEDAPAVIALLMQPYVSVLETGSGFTHEEVDKMRNRPDMQTAGAAVENILLSAVDLGLGACWLSAPMIAREELEHLMGVEEPYKLINFVAVGKPFGAPAKKNKKPLNEILQFIE